MGNVTALKPGYRLDAVQGNTLYYYIQLDYADGSMVRFPSGSPAADVIETPIRVPQNQPPEGQTARIDYRIMSPLPDEPVAADEALIAIAFFYPEGSVDAGGFRLMVKRSGCDSSGRGNPLSYYLCTGGASNGRQPCAPCLSRPHP